jgi:hypothetical protein
MIMDNLQTRWENRCTSIDLLLKEPMVQLISPPLTKPWNPYT